MAALFQKFQSLIENSPDAISLVDQRGKILYGSESTGRLFGYPPEDLIGRNCLDLIHPEDRDQSDRALQDVVRNPPGLIQWEARALHKNSNDYSWVENTASNFLLASEVQAILVRQRDIGERKAEEKERQRLAEALIQSNLRLEEFAYTAAHDLREPLRAISLCTKLLVRKTQMDPETRKIAGFIVDGAARMSALIADLLSYATTGVQETPQPVRLQDAVAQAMLNLSLSIQESGAIVTVDPLPLVHCNEIQLVRLFQNLIGNAVKYCNENSIEIQICANRCGPDWVIGVTDNGVGIAPRDQARIFMPFIRLANRCIPGTGLGLAACKKIVEGYGGAIWVESKLGAGSTFFFTIREGEDLALAHAAS